MKVELTFSEPETISLSGLRKCVLSPTPLQACFVLLAECAVELLPRV